MASPSSTSNKKVTLKLLIDTKNDKVLFAEASKAVVDFLFNLLCLPIGTVVKLLTKNDMVGSLGNLYQSVEDLNQSYMQPNQTKDVLLNPKAQSSSTQIAGLLTKNTIVDDDGAINETRFYTCQRDTVKTSLFNDGFGGGGFSYGSGGGGFSSSSIGSRCNSNDVSCLARTLCSGCSQPMTRELRFVGKKVDAAEQETNFMKSGFVKDVVTFMVMDDLVIQPMSTISGITLLNKFNVKDIGALQEKIVEMGMEEGVKLLKASLHSKMVLTNVFMKKQY